MCVIEDEAVKGGPSKFNVTSEKTEGGASITITKVPNEAPDDTYFGVAKQVLSVPMVGREGLGQIHAVEAIIKKYGHCEKLSVYQRLQLHFFRDGTPKTLEEFQRWHERLKEFVDLKLETHRSFSKLPITQQIYGRGDWHKEKSDG
jgi:hypothetical protein